MNPMLAQKSPCSSSGINPITCAIVSARPNCNPNDEGLRGSVTFNLCVLSTSTHPRQKDETGSQGWHIARHSMSTPAIDRLLEPPASRPLIIPSLSYCPKYNQAKRIAAQSDCARLPACESQSSGVWLPGQVDSRLTCSKPHPF